MGAIGAAMAVSSMSSLASGYSQSKAIEANADYQESVAQTNNVLLGIQAKQVKEAGDTEAFRKSSETTQKLGMYRAARGASGIDVNSGSSKVTQIGIESVGALDELTIRNNTARKAWGYKVQGMLNTQNAELARMTAKAQSRQTLLTSGIKAISTPLTMYALGSKGGKSSGTGSGQPFDMSTSGGAAPYSSNEGVF